MLVPVIVVTYACALHSWAVVFWSSVEPKVRSKLSRLWQVDIVWKRTARGRAWAIRGPEKGRGSAVTGASMLVWWWGLFMPPLVVAAALTFGWIGTSMGSILIVETLALTPFTSVRTMLRS
jgi:hypothetical protein